MPMLAFIRTRLHYAPHSNLHTNKWYVYYNKRTISLTNLTAEAISN